MSDTLQSNDDFILSLSVKELLNIGTSNLTRRQFRIRTLLLTYAKHHLNSEDISWHELNDIIFDDLRNTVGDKPYQKWISEFNTRND